MSIESQRDKLAGLESRRADLMGELNRSLDLRAFYPEAFEHGACSSSVVGSPSKGFRFVVKRGNGDKREWPIGEVPASLTAKAVAQIPERYRPEIQA